MIGVGACGKVHTALLIRNEIPAGTVRATDALFPQQNSEKAPGTIPA
jgi:hypothetical protein